MFNDLLKVSMNNPKIKNEHQISSLLNEYKKNVNFNLHHTDNWYDCGDLFSYYESKNLLLIKELPLENINFHRRKELGHLKIFLTIIQ